MRQASAFATLPAPVADALLGVVALAVDGPAVNDIHLPLQALLAAHPDRPELAIALAQQHLVAGDVADAREVLESAEQHGARHPLLGALLAFTLHALKDPAWRLRAYEVESEPHDSLCDSLLAALHD
jgi:type III secretion protein HrpB1